MSKGNLILHYPCKIESAPDLISRQIAENLVQHQDSLQYEINLLPEYSKSLRRKSQKLDMSRDLQKNCTIISLNQARKLLKSKDTLVHITKSFFFAYDKKTLLSLYSSFKCPERLITNFHADIGLSAKNKLWNGQLIEFVTHFPTYVSAPYILSHSGTIIVNSPFMVERFLKEYNVHSVLIPNAIDDWWIANNSSVEQNVDGDPIFFYHGRIAQEKGVDLLVKAFAKLKRDYKTAKLYLSGSGPLCDPIRSYVNRFCLEDSVVLLGHVPNEALKCYIKAADAALYPSRYEPFSLATLEALSCANNIVGISSNVGLAGFLTGEYSKIPVFDSSTDGIYNFLVSVCEKVFSKEVATLQRKFASQFTWDKIIYDYIHLYNSFA